MAEAGSPGQAGASSQEAGGFASTHWSVVLAAKNAITDTTAFGALSELCQTYWRPLYAFLRRRGYAPHDAEDLVQDFFGSFLATDPLRNVSPDRGRFRNFILKCLQNHASKAHRRTGTLRRGANSSHISLNASDAEQLVDSQLRVEQPAERVFDRVWAQTVMQNAALRLREEYAEDGRTTQYEVLCAWLAQEPKPGEYEAAATRLGVAPATIPVQVHRLRRRLQELVRLEVGRTVGTPGELQAELDYLLEVMTG